MVGDQRSAQTHEFGEVAKAPHIDAGRRDTRCFDCSLNVPHGHMTHRSNGYEYGRVGAEISSHIGPLLAYLASHKPLRSSPHE